MCLTSQNQVFLLFCCAFLAFTEGCTQEDSLRSTVSRSENTAYLRERHSDAPGLSASESPLSEDLRSHVWDIEHLGFVIEATVFSKLKVELNNSRTDFWKSLLSNECEVFLPRADVEWQTVAAGTGKFSRGLTLFSAVEMNQKQLKGLQQLAEGEFRLALCLIVADSNSYAERC